MIVIYCPIYRQFFYIFFLTLQKVKVLFWSLQYFMNLLSIQALLFLLLAFSFFFNAALNPKIDCLTNCDNIHISIEEFSYHYYNRIDFFFWLYWRCYSTVYHVTQNCFQKITSFVIALYASWLGFVWLSNQNFFLIFLKYRHSWFYESRERAKLIKCY